MSVFECFLIILFEICWLRFFFLLFLLPGRFKISKFIPFTPMKKKEGKEIKPFIISQKNLTLIGP